MTLGLPCIASIPPCNDMPYNILQAILDAAHESYSGTIKTMTTVPSVNSKKVPNTYSDALIPGRPLYGHNHPKTTPSTTSYEHQSTNYLFCYTMSRLLAFWSQTTKLSSRTPRSPPVPPRLVPHALRTNLYAMEIHPSNLPYLH